MEKKTENKIKYFLYARKSSETDDKQVASIDSQINELKRLANRDNLEIVEILSESKSAKEPGRPVFTQMMARINTGEAQGIICWKLDRLARNPIDGGYINWMLQQGKIQHIKTFEKGYFPTDNSIMISVEFGMSNQYIRDLSINVKRGQRNKVENGWLPGPAPIGYLNTPDREKGYKIIIDDPERQPIVRRIFDMILTGNYTAPQILKIVNKDLNFKTFKRRVEGGRPMARSTIYKMLSNPFYYGYFEYPSKSGNWFKGNHNPIITINEYERVQAILGKNGKPSPKKHIFAFTGLMRCASCGSSITAENKIKRQKNGNVHYYIYYHCTKKKNPDCLEKSIELKDLKTQVDNILESITIPEEFKNWAIKHLHEIRKTESETQYIAFSNKQKELNQTNEQLNSLLLKYTSAENSDGQLISDSEYKTFKNGLLKRKECLESELNDKSKQLDQWLELSEKTFNFARYARNWFNNGDTNTQRAILACLGSNLLVKDGKINVELHPVYQILFDNKKTTELELCSARTSNSLISERKNGDILSVRPSWLRE